MYAGAERSEQSAELRGWLNFPSSQWQERSVFSVKQDVRLLNDNIVRASLAEPLQALIAKRGLRAERIDWFLPHISSYFFQPAVAQAMVGLGVDLATIVTLRNLEQGLRLCMRSRSGQRAQRADSRTRR